MKLIIHQVLMLVHKYINLLYIYTIIKVISVAPQLLEYGFT